MRLMLNIFGFFRLCSVLFLARSQRILTHSQLLPPSIRNLPNSPYPYETQLANLVFWHTPALNASHTRQMQLHQPLERRHRQA